MLLTRDHYTENSVFKLKEHFIEPAGDSKNKAVSVRNFNALARYLGGFLTAPAQSWQDFSQRPRTTWASGSFVYDRDARVVFPVKYGGHSVPSALLYIYHTKQDLSAFFDNNIGAAVVSDTVFKLADRYIIEGFGVTYGTGRGLIVGAGSPLSSAERRVFVGVSITTIGQKDRSLVRERGE